MARSLVADPHLAADLAQDAWLATQGAPSPRGDRRPWLLGTLRNLARRAFRSGGRRQLRELARDALPAAEATADLLARTELHGRLLQLVRELPESYRTPLLLRFFDDLPPRSIARRLGMPVNTVNTRIQRGLARLRDRLDTEHGGDRRAWVALLLLPKARPVVPGPLASAEVVAAAAIVVAAIAVVTWRPWTIPSPSVPAAPVAAVGPESPAGVDQARRSVPAADVSRVDVPPQLIGRVVDWDGRPVAHASIAIAAHLGIHWHPEADEAVELDAGPATTLPRLSAIDGAFALPLPTSPIELRAVASEHTCAAVGIWRPDVDYSPRVVLARAASVASRVVDQRGIGVADASVRIELPTTGGGAGTQRGLHVLAWRTSTAADGTFALAGVPAVAGAQLHLRKTGHVTQVVPLSATSGPLTLPRWEQSFGGRIVDERGAPIADATVAGNGAAAATDADGAFELPGERGLLQVAARGHRPTSFAAIDGMPLALVDPDQNIAGHLRLADGRPAAAWSISLADPTCVGDPREPVVLEAVAGDSGRLIHRATTGPDGSFRLPGLADRAYRLRCVDPATAAMFVTAPMLPGSAATIVLPADLWLPELRLALRAADGAALARAHVSVQGTAYGLPSADGDERTVLFSQGTSARSDETGTVELQRVPSRHAYLRIQHPSTGVVMMPIADAVGGPIVLPRQGELLVRCSDPGRCTWFELCATDGQAVAVDCMQGICTRRAQRWTLVGGRSPVLTVPETAVAVRFGDASGERGRRPLLVRPGALVALDL